MSNHMSSKVSGEIAYPFPNCTDAEVNFIPHFVMDVITYKKIKVNPC